MLFIDACARGGSRTRALAEKLLARLNAPCETLRLYETELPVVDEAYIGMRDGLIGAGDFDSPAFALARQFAGADAIVIAAPYWDLSFPAVLKRYIELINVVGVTFRYTEDGRPEGLCRAKRLYYVATAGGGYVPEAFGFGYIEALAKNFYGIQDVRLIQAVGLDIYGADVPAILKAAEDGLDAAL